jgi:hypothetical protein
MPREAIAEEIEQLKARVRAGVEYSFRVITRQFSGMPCGQETTR